MMPHNDFVFKKDFMRRIFILVYNNKIELNLICFRRHPDEFVCEIEENKRISV